MDDALVVGGDQRRCDLVDERRGLADVNGARATQPRAQRFTDEQIHHVVAAAVGQRAECKDVDDVGMADLVDRPRLGGEAFECGGLLR